MSESRIKQCCKRSRNKGLADCEVCHNPLWPDTPSQVSLLPDETTLVRDTPSNQSDVSRTIQNRSDKRLNRTVWFTIMIAVSFAVFAALILADYYVQRRAGESVAIVPHSSPTPAVSSPTTTVMPTPQPTHSPTPESDNHDALLDSLVQSPTPTPKPKPTPSLPPYDDSTAKPTATPLPYIAALPTSRGTPRPARRDLVVSASDVLSTLSKPVDSRIYRFHLEAGARIKGSFSASGGGVSVRIFTSDRGYYSSGSAASSDTIDVTLNSGTYQVEVYLQSQREIVSFRINITAYYDPE